MHAIVLNATLKPSPETSNTEALADVVIAGLARHDVTAEKVRLVDENVAPGVVSESVREGDGWPAIHDKLLEADILIVATPTWVGQPSSEAKRAIERMDAMLSETSEDGTPVAFNKVAGVLVTGNEDGAHHCIGEIAGALGDIGYTIPGQSWTYWNKGPGPGDEEYLNTDDREWTHETAAAMAHVLAHTARALQATPIPKPPNA